MLTIEFPMSRHMEEKQKYGYLCMLLKNTKRLVFCNNFQNAALLSQNYYPRLIYNEAARKLTFISLDGTKKLHVKLADDVEWRNFSILICDLVATQELSLEEFLRSKIWLL